MRGILITLPSSTLPEESLSPSQRCFSVRNRMTLGRAYDVVDREGGNLVVRDDDGRLAYLNPQHLLFPQVRPPSHEDGHAIRAMLRGMCLDGACYELAIALHRYTDLPLVGLWSPTASGDDGVPGTWRHAAVRLGDGFVDARGPVTAEEFGLPFGEPRPWDVRDISESDLRRVRPVPAEGLPSLSKLAQAAWPQLPWTADSYQERAAAFLDELEALSRRHALWVRAPYPAAQPMLAEGNEDELGYDARITDDGLCVSFDRGFSRIQGHRN